MNQPQNTKSNTETVQKR
jgi:hypothetical protein